MWGYKSMNKIMKDFMLSGVGLITFIFLILIILIGLLVLFIKFIIWILPTILILIALFFIYFLLWKRFKFKVKRKVKKKNVIDVKFKVK